MKKIYTTLFLMLITVLSIAQPVLADNSPLAQHKEEGFPTWGYCMIGWFIFVAVVFIMPTIVTGPALEWWEKRKAQKKSAQKAPIKSE